MSAYDKYGALGDGDLTPEQLDGMEMWDRDVMLAERHRAVGSMLVRRACAEIRRRRAAGTASADQVRAAIRAAVIDVLPEAQEDATAIADRVAALTAPDDGSAGWRAGIEASIRHLETMERKPRDLWRPAYFAAVDEALVHLQAMLARGTDRATTPVAAAPLAPGDSVVLEVDGQIAGMRTAVDPK